MKILGGLASYTSIFIISSIYVGLLEGYLVGKIDVLPLLIGLVISSAIYFLRERSLTLSYMTSSNPYEEGYTPYILILFAALVEGLYLLCFPIFPGNQSRDFLVYTSVALDLVKDASNILSIRNPAIYALLASIFSISRDIVNPLLIGRIFIYILTLMVYPLVYEIAESLYGRYAGLISVLTIFLTNFFWKLTFPFTGLYANLLGLVLILYLVLLIIRYDESGYDRMIIPITLVLLAALISHETSYIIIPVILLTGFYELIAKKKIILLKTIVPILVIGGLLLLSLYTEKHVLEFLISNLIYLKPVTGWEGIQIRVADPIYRFISQYSIFMADIYSQGGILSLVAFIFSIGEGFYLLYKRVNGVKIIPLVLIILIWILSLYIDNEWRLAGYSLYPAGILMGNLINQLKTIDLKKKFLRKMDKRLKTVLLILIVEVLLVSSNVVNTVIVGIESYEYRPQRQAGVYDAFNWVRYNTPNDSVILSVGCWEFKYVELFTGREYIGDYLYMPDEMLNVFRSENITSVNIYVALFANLRDADSNQYYRIHYDMDPHYQIVYENEVIIIYKVIL